MTSSRSRSSTCWDAVVFSSLFFSLFSCGGSFKVTVPAANLFATRRHTIVLGCEFTPDPSNNLSNLVITWQRKEDSRVVHSFYYSKDQLALQNSDYWNRTALFYTEFVKGNASLRISDVRLSDAGLYQCMVSTLEGTDSAELRLDYGALFTEPRLSISFSSSEMKMQYEAEGYPEPDVRWLDTQGKNLSHETTSYQEAGLYYLKSSYVTQTTAANVTFVLKNQLMNQDLQRHISFNCAGGSANGTAVVLAVIVSLLCVLLLFIAWLYWNKKRNLG